MILVHFFCALSWGYGIKKVSLRLKNEFYEDKDRCQFRKLKKLKKIKKIKTNEVCHNISFNILNGHDNAAIVVVCFLSFIFPKRKSIMPQEQTNIKERTKQELKEPDMYKVIMHNDDFTTMDFVVMVLKTVFYKDEATAHKLMLTVHKQGKAQIGLYTLDIAVSKCQRAMTMARKEGFPFLVTWEPDR